MALALHILNRLGGLKSFGLGKPLVPKLHLGTQLSAQLRCLSSAPRIAFKQWMPADKPLMRRRIPPMFLRRNQPPQHRIVVNIIQFLLHHLVTSDFLRMQALLPHLVRAVPLMQRTIISELIEQPFALLHLDLLQQGARRKSLEIRQRIRQVRRGENGMKMIIENDPGVNLQTLMLPAMEQGFNKNIATGRRRKNRQPFDNG